MYPTLNKTFELDLKEGISQMVYPETGERGTAPFYLGEMVTAWKLPPVTRINAARVAHGWLPDDKTVRRLQDNIPKTDPII